MEIHFAFSAGTTAVATALALLPAIRLLRAYNVFDLPNVRSSHGVPTVRGAGIVIVAIAASRMLGLAFRDRCIVALLVALFALASVSFIDDLRGLRPAVRFLVQAAAAATAVITLFHGLGGWTWSSDALAALAWVWIAGYTNAFNFMDGINGIAACQAMLTSLATAVVAVQLGLRATDDVLVLSGVIAGTALGFLPYNFPRARAFMGDVGSASLGYLLATLAVWVAQRTWWWVLLWIALLHANFVFDTAITFVRRALRRERLHEAHREHFYQRLVRAGYSHTWVTLAEALLQVIVAVAVCWATTAGWKWKVSVAVMTVAIWLTFFTWAEVRFRQAHARVSSPAR